MRDLWLELQRAARGLCRTPLVLVAAVLSIGLAVGAVTAVFSWLDGLVLHPFPAVPEEGRLAGIEVGEPNGGMGAWSYPTYKELQRSLRSFAGVAAWGLARVSAREPGEAGSSPLLATTVSGSYFDVLRVAPVAGRAIGEPDVEAVAPVAMLGHQFWIERYHGDPAVLGRQLLLNGQGVRIVGILPPGFSGIYTGVVPQLYVPITIQPLLTGTNRLVDRKQRFWLLFARLRDGVSLAAAGREADAVARRISRSYGDRPAPGAEVMFLRVQFLGRTLSPLFLAMLSMSLLLALLATANVASLLLLRAEARRGETALRRALGASTWEVARAATSESALLALLGGAAGVGAAYAARGALYAFVPRGTFPLSLPIPISWRVLLLACLAALLVALACLGVPAVAVARVSAQATLGGAARSLGVGSMGSSRARTAIVSLQLALSVLSLVVAGMFARGLRAAAVDVGFSDPEHVLLVDTHLGTARLTGAAGVASLRALLSRLRDLPGVRSASVASMVPLGFGGREIVEAKVEGLAPPPDNDASTELAHVGPEYATTMRIPLLRGRDVADGDRAGAPPVALVNEAFVKRFLPGADPIGRRVDAGRGWATIVGLLHDGKYDRLDEPLHPVVYVPMAQWLVPAMTIHLRTAGDPRALAETVRRTLASIHPDLPALQARTLAEHISASTFVPRTGTEIAGAFASLGLVLAVVGLYGALAFSVALRRREIAVRMALGARGGAIGWSVGRRALAMVGIGAPGGILLAFAAGGMLRARIASLPPPDPALALLAAAVLAAAALLAAWLPAREAVRVDPAAALKGD